MKPRAVRRTARPPTTANSPGTRIDTDTQTESQKSSLISMVQAWRVEAAGKLHTAIALRDVIGDSYVFIVQLDVRLRAKKLMSN